MTIVEFKTLSMRNPNQDPVKVAVYCANLPAPEQQRFQEKLAMLIMGLGALAALYVSYIL